MIGTKPASFEITKLLGKGGMGEVWLARDTKLDRNQSIESLPAHLATDPERLSRFEREASLPASLNRADIAQVHGFDEANGTRFGELVRTP